MFDVANDQIKVIHFYIRHLKYKCCWEEKALGLVCFEQVLWRQSWSSSRTFGWLFFLFCRQSWSSSWTCGWLLFMLRSIWMCGWWLFGFHFQPKLIIFLWFCKKKKIRVSSNPNLNKKVFDPRNKDSTVFDPRNKDFI